MRFLFYPYNCIPLYRNILDERPLGGVETGAIHFGNALARLGHQVFIVSEIEDKAEMNPRFIKPNEVHLCGDLDLFLAIRGWPTIFLPIPRKKTMLWTGDSANIVHNFGIGDPRVFINLDALLCVSSWQANMLCRNACFPQQKVYLLRNGVFLPHFEGREERKRKRLIFTMHPSRGIEFLLPIFNILKAKHPDLELHIFSGSKIHKQEDPRWDPIFNELRKTDGCVVHGNVLQKQLSRELMRSSIWIYPTHVSETSCISAMEAQAAGCAIVASALGALPETVGQAGILLSESAEYIMKFADAVDKLLSDEILLHSYSQKGLEQAKSYDWNLRAASFLEFFLK